MVPWTGARRDVVSAELGRVVSALHLDVGWSGGGVRWKYHTGPGTRRGVACNRHAPSELLTLLTFQASIFKLTSSLELRPWLSIGFEPIGLLNLRAVTKFKYTGWLSARKGETGTVGLNPAVYFAAFDRHRNGEA